MTTFAYTAVNRGGSKSSGSIPADSRAAAMDALSAKGLIPVEIKETAGSVPAKASAGAPSSKVPKKAVEAFTRELANLLSGGLSLSRGLALLKREAHHPAAKFVWGRVHDDVVGGEALADAMARWPNVFSDVYVAMIRAGEAGGFLHVVLAQISDFRQREADLTGKVKTALIYPIALATIATGVMIFLLTFFIPRFKTIFAQFGSDLPFLTKIVVAVSGSLLTYGPFVAVAVVIGVVALKRHSQTEHGRRQMERILLKTPALGIVLSRFALVRFTRMLGTLLGAGVPLIAALKVARAALGNKTLQDTVDTAIDEVQRGTPLSRALAEDKLLFPTSAIEMISVAEETGRLNEELVRLSGSYETDLDRNLKILVALAEPILLLFMASAIGTVVVSMLLPLFTLQDMIK